MEDYHTIPYKKLTKQSVFAKRKRKRRAENSTLN
jgi:hypothetical protein